MEKAEMKIAVDADLIHRRHHLVTRDVIGPVRHTVPGSLRGVRLIGMDLGIDDSHRGSSSVLSELVSHQVRIEKGQASCVADAGGHEQQLPTAAIVLDAGRDGSKSFRACSRIMLDRSNGRSSQSASRALQ